MTCASRHCLCRRDRVLRLATKLFESMAVGKAIVASALGWIVDSLDHLLTEESG